MELEHKSGALSPGQSLGRGLELRGVRRNELRMYGCFISHKARVPCSVIAHSGLDVFLQAISHFHHQGLAVGDASSLAASVTKDQFVGSAAPVCCGEYGVWVVSLLVFSFGFLFHSLGHFALKLDLYLRRSLRR